MYSIYCNTRAQHTGASRNSRSCTITMTATKQKIFVIGYRNVLFFRFFFCFIKKTEKKTFISTSNCEVFNFFFSFLSFFARLLQLSPLIDMKCTCFIIQNQNNAVYKYISHSEASANCMLFPLMKHAIERNMHVYECVHVAASKIFQFQTKNPRSFTRLSR